MCNHYSCSVDSGQSFVYIFSDCIRLQVMACIERYLFLYGYIFFVFFFVTGLPKNFSLRDYRPPTEVPCIVRLLCEKHEGLQMEAKEIKEHWFKPYIRKLFDRQVAFVLNYL